MRSLAHAANDCPTTAALELACRGLKQRPSHRSLRIARGRYLLQHERPEEALVDFRAVLAQRADAHAYNGVVMACSQARQYKEALHHARAALRTLPDSPVAECLVGLCHLQARPLRSCQCAQRIA